MISGMSSGVRGLVAKSASMAGSVGRGAGQGVTFMGTKMGGTVGRY